MFINRVVFALLVFAIAGCAANTAAFNQNQSACLREAARFYPVSMRSREVKVPYTAEVKTGKTICETSPPIYDNQGREIGGRRTVCKDETEFVTRYRTKTVTEDVNKDLRAQQSESCVKRMCEEKYGNSKCLVSAPSGNKPLYSKEVALEIISQYFGNEWAKDPTGQYFMPGGKVCGNSGIGKMPYKEMDRYEIRYEQGIPKLVIYDYRWMLIWGPCGTLGYALLGNYQNQDIERMVVALRSLGADFQNP